MFFFLFFLRKKGKSGIWKERQEKDESIMCPVLSQPEFLEVHGLLDNRENVLCSGVDVDRGQAGDGHLYSQEFTSGIPTPRHSHVQQCADKGRGPFTVECAEAKKRQHPHHLGGLTAGLWQSRLISYGGESELGLVCQYLRISHRLAHQ